MEKATLANKSRNLVLIGLMMGLFLAAIEITVVSTAMPTAVKDLGGAELYNWVFTAYILTITISGPLWGRLSDLFGRRKIYISGVIIFILASGLSGISSNILQLIIFRAIQGLGGGALLTLTFTIVGEIYKLKERSKVQGYMSTVWAIASIIGPPTGGFLADSVDWRWVFFLNIPFGIVAALSIVKWLRYNEKRVSAKIDYLGTILFSISSLLLLFFITEYSSLGTFGLIILGISVSLIILFFKIESSTLSPLIPLDLLRDKTISISLLANLLLGISFFGVIAYIPILLQWSFNLSASDSGVLLVPITLGWVISSILAARVLPLFNLKPIVLLSGFFLSIGMAILTFFQNSNPIIVGGFLLGLGMGSAIAPLLIVVQTVVKSESLGIATALQGFMRTLGGTLGVTLMWIPIKNSMGEINFESALILSEIEQKTLSSAIQQSFIIGLVAALICIPLYLLLPKLDLEEKDRKRFSND